MAILKVEVNYREGDPQTYVVPPKTQVAYERKFGQPMMGENLGMTGIYWLAFHASGGITEHGDTDKGFEAWLETVQFATTKADESPLD